MSIDIIEFYCYEIGCFINVEILTHYFDFRNSLKCIDPWLMAPTSIFLASKVEVSNHQVFQINSVKQGHYYQTMKGFVSVSFC
jgi:hypothetical protein